MLTTHDIIATTAMQHSLVQRMSPRDVNALTMMRPRSRQTMQKSAT